MIRFTSLAAFALTLASWTALAQPSTPFVVTKTLVDDSKAVIATIESVRDVQARARINGTVSLLAVKEGDSVKAGDKIAVVGDPKLAIRGQGMDSRIMAAQSAFDKAKIDFTRADELRRAGYGTQAKLDEARAVLDIAQHTLDAAKAEKQEVAQTATEGAVLAPGAGRVLKVPVAVGSVVMAGEVVATLSQENSILRLELPERHARFIKAGDKVRIGPRGLGPLGAQETKTGTIRLVYPEIKDGRVRADVTAEGLDGYFVGERALVYVATGQREAIMIPETFVFRRAGVDFVRLEGGYDVPVQTGAPQGSLVEVLSGLRDGDRVEAP